MNSKAAFQTFTSLLCATSFVQGANIVLVSDSVSTTDVPFVNYLTNLGHVVTGTDQQFRTLGVSDIAQLNAADLVIVSRNTNSGDYATDAGEVAQWDAITSTVLLGSAYLVRDNRWGWVTSSSGPGNYSGDITAPTVGAATHPIYSGLAPSVGLGFSGNDKYLFTTGTDVETGNNNLVASGTVIGVRNNATAQHIIAAEFNEGAVTGSGNALAGDRFYFPMPVSFANNNANGLQMIDNTIGYLVPEPSSFALSLVGLLALARRCR